MRQDDHEIEVFVHQEGAEPKVVKASFQESVSFALQNAGVDVGAGRGLLVFVGESNSVFSETRGVDEGDSHEPVSVNATLQELGVRNHEHLHCVRCRRVGVTVNYQSESGQRRFSPAATIHSVTLWSRKRFHLTDASVGKLVLIICGSNEQPRQNVHLGEIVHAPSCDVCFDLVREYTVQG